MEKAKKKSKKYRPLALISKQPSYTAIFIVYPVFIIPFLAIGYCSYLAALKNTFIFDIFSQIPKVYLLPLGALATIIAITFMVAGIRAYFTNSKLKTRAKKKPDQPWNWDYNWNLKGIKLATFSSLAVHILILLLILGFMLLALGNILALIFFGLFLALILFNFIKLVKYSKVKCLYKSFPFFLGENLQVEIHGLPSKERVLNLNAKLNLICAKSEDRKNANQEKKINYYIVHQISQKIEKSKIRSGKIYLKLALPNDERLTTNLIERKSKYYYWELRVKAEVRGVDFDFGFPVPIYLK